MIMIFLPCIDEMTGDDPVSVTSNSFKAELNDKGWRMTPQREMILQIFQGLPQGEHLSVEDLHELLLAREMDVSLSTIYRTVKLMARMGILRELELAEGHKHYEINEASSHHHHHMVCVQCNRTIEFENDAVLKQSMKQVEKSGYQLIDCQLTVYAICPEAIRMGYPALPSETWMCSRAIADTSKHQKKVRSKHQHEE
jgi:Fur family transcriptional regulator, ferric uptake regulator